MTGKERCEFLRTVRINMAKKNGIPYTPKECNNETDCYGTCPLCEYEAKVLMEQLQKKIDDEGSVIVDSESINKLNQSDSVQVEGAQVDDGSNVIDLYPVDKEPRYHRYTRLTGDISDDDDVLYVVPKSPSAWYEIKEILKLLSLFPKAIYRYLTTRAKIIKMK